LIATFGLGDGLSPIGKRQDFWSDLGNSLLDAVTDTANSLLSGNFCEIKKLYFLKIHH
jgi:hypothetical protein